MLMRPPRKLGGWPERWDSREPCTGSTTIPKPFIVRVSRESQRSAHPPSLRGGRIYIVFKKCSFCLVIFSSSLSIAGNSKSIHFAWKFFSLALLEREIQKVFILPGNFSL